MLRIFTNHSVFLLDDSLSTTISWVLTTMDRALYFFSIELRSFCHRNPPPCCGFHQDILMKVSDESLGQRGGRLGTFFITECCENSVRMVVRWPSKNRIESTNDSLWFKHEKWWLNQKKHRVLSLDQFSGGIKQDAQQSQQTLVRASFMVYFCCHKQWYKLP